MKLSLRNTSTIGSDLIPVLSSTEERGSSTELNLCVPTDGKTLAFAEEFTCLMFKMDNFTSEIFFIKMLYI